MPLRNITNPAGASLPDTRVVDLGLVDLDRIVCLEAATWTNSMQADREVVAQRLEMGHIMMGVEANGELIGMIASRFAMFDPDDRGSFPDTFDEFSNRAQEPVHNAAFVYSLHALPEVRGHGVPQQLMLAGRSVTIENGCRYVVGDGRCPSYNGCTDIRCDRVKNNPEFRAVIDRAVEVGRLPPVEDLILDPVLRFYHRVLMCTFTWVIPAFVPEDEPSGGHRVIFYNEYDVA